MKFTDRTKTILKNFAGINPSIVLKKGNVQETLSSDGGSVLAIATLDEKIPETYGIFDLNMFLGNLTTLDNPEVKIKDLVAELDDGQVKLTYYGCTPGLVIVPPDEKLEITGQSFTLSNDIFQKIYKLGTMNALPYITFKGGAKGVEVIASDKANDTSNSARIKVSDDAVEDFEVDFKAEFIQLIPQNYKVTVNENYASFEGDRLTYFVAAAT